MTNAYSITGMTCSHCAQAVHQSLAKVAGIASVTVDLDKATATIESDQPIALPALQAALAHTIYEIEAPVASDAAASSVQMDELSEQNKQLVADYITAVGRLDDRWLSEYLHPDFQYNGMLQYHSAADYLQVIREHAASPMASMLARNEIQAIFADGDECCAIYNLITSIPGKQVPFAEQVKIKDGKVISTDVKLNKYCMKQLSQEINKMKRGV